MNNPPESEIALVIDKGKLEMDLAKIHNSWRCKLGLFILRIAEWIFGKGIKVSYQYKRKKVENEASS